MLKSLGKCSLYRLSKAHRGQQLFLYYFLFVQKTYKTDLRNMLDDIIDSVSGKLYSRLLFFGLFFSNYYPLIVSLSYPIDLLMSSLLAPVQIM